MKKTPNYNLPLFELNDNVWESFQDLAGEKLAPNESALQLIDRVLKNLEDTKLSRSDALNLINERINQIVGTAPEALNTLQEIASALNNDADFANTIINQLSTKANASDVYTKAEVDNKLGNVNIDMSAYATIEYVNTQIGNVETILSDINSGSGGVI